ncbi:ComEC/Rec2 family competence protein [Sinomicrobium oceani]|uniref:ComEC/Rec2 family competence protein n=1 Tax=Sinomicrobium oceani TaxID=1150368 RepID=UPI00227C82C8|nr:ComEC/Rec2 family competence protein [Sinomicrobium oceani]
MQLLNSQIFRLLLFLSAGIWVGFYTSPSPPVVYGILTLLFVVLGLLYYRLSGPVFSHGITFGLIAWCFTFVLGVLISCSRKPEFTPDHYTHFTKEKPMMYFTPVSVLKPGDRYFRYIVRIKSVNGRKTSGKALLYLYRDSTTAGLSMEKQYGVRSDLHTINPSRNPHEFDYSDYLKKQYVYQSFNVIPGDLHIFPGSENGIHAHAERLRQHITASLKKHDLAPGTFSMIQALLLGQRQYIPEDLYRDYTDAGAIHILAISGLHIGIIMMMLYILFRPLLRFRHGNLISFFLTAGILWCFAFLTGMSASVTRAVCMFSFIALGLQLRRTTNINDVLLASIFFLLLLQPGFLFDIGFQFSYLAVFAIVKLQPVFYNWWRPRWRFTDAVWKLTTVSLAAQAGVLPLSLYYFHQFPGLFLLSNLFIIPLLGLILGGGIFIIILALLDILPSFLLDSYTWGISGMNLLISGIARQELFIFRNIPFHPVLLIISYGFLIASFSYLRNRSYRKLYPVLILVLCMQGFFFYQSYRASRKDHWIVLHKNRETRILRHYGKHLVIHSSDTTANALQDRMLTDYIMHEGIRKTEIQPVHSVYDIYGSYLMHIVSENAPLIEQPRIDYLLLSNSPTINLERFIQAYRPKVVIADGSNYASLVMQWRLTCAKEKLPFHNTYEKGAYIFSPE